MKKLALLFVAAALLVGCAPSGPPAQVQGTWTGWAEETLDIKTGLVLELTQKEKEITGKYQARVVNAMGEQTHDGDLKGTVRGDEVTLTFSNPELNLKPEVTLKVGEEDGARVMKGYVQEDQSGIGTKYFVKETKKK